MSHLFILFAGLMSFMVGVETPTNEKNVEHLDGKIVARSFPSIRCVLQATEVDPSEIGCECYFAYVFLVEPKPPDHPSRYIIIALGHDRALPIGIDDLASFTYSASVAKSQTCDRQVKFEPVGSDHVLGTTFIIGSDQVIEGESKCEPIHDWYPVGDASLLPEEGTLLPGYLVRNLTWQEE